MVIYRIDLHSGFGIDWFSWCANLTRDHCCSLLASQTPAEWQWVCQITHCGATKHLRAALICRSAVLNQPLGRRLSPCSSLRGRNPDSDTRHAGQRGDGRTTGDLLIHWKPKVNTAAAMGRWCRQLEWCVCGGCRGETVILRVISVRYMCVCGDLCTSMNEQKGNLD